ncbi:YqiA/YcfP family alpha/beta fold hydrolase [Prosthecobacter sp. SYSU 5D2]|uniref:YqiA/YcfP family alpha/beta fold hydrolase n=1 Tax=Prosthecobacter sp. SYSU 5D2 TaxID=3134134 RepID=UPI0031FF35C5
MRKLIYEAPTGRATELVVLLPGRHSKPEEFVREGIVRQVQEKRPGSRIIVPDLHLRYYMERTASQCLWEEIIHPARQKGLPVTLMGVSLGGLGALITWLEHPQDIRQVLLLAPYLGEEELMTEIRENGLATSGFPLKEPHNQEDAMRLLWVKMHKLKSLATSPALPIRLSCGRKDRHLSANRLFAERFLSPEQYQEVAGGHDWAAWRQGAAWLLR